MIDFRYHIVSLVSVFIALAVGIVLGAGPLQKQIGETLTNQVTQLRAEKDALRADLELMREQVDADDNFATAITPNAVGSSLTGRSLVLVLLPGSSEDDADALTDVFEAAGARVTGRVTVESAWTDPEQESERQKVMSETPKATTNDAMERQLAATLASALIGSDIAVPRAASPENAPTSLESATANRFRDAGLISYSDDDLLPARSAVFLSGPPAESVPAPQRAVMLSSWQVLVQEFDAVDDGTVVTGPLPDAEAGGLLAAIRESDEARSAISTVEDSSTGRGRLVTAFALQEQLLAGVGHYGVGPGADKVLPENLVKPR
ncbi:MAG: copper transporter [Actinomycetota bacterium]